MLITSNADKQFTEYKENSTFLLRKKVSKKFVLNSLYFIFETVTTSISTEPLNCKQYKNNNLAKTSVFYYFHVTYRTGYYWDYIIVVTIPI